uniref:Zinc finger protein 747 n=1 Tax=Mus musculus TaxID=10090 RepID=A0A0U1RP29_MOUSE
MAQVMAPGRASVPPVFCKPGTVSFADVAVYFSPEEWRRRMRQTSAHQLGGGRVRSVGTRCPGSRGGHVQDRSPLRLQAREGKEETKRRD